MGALLLMAGCSRRNNAIDNNNVVVTDDFGTTFHFSIDTELERYPGFFVVTNSNYDKVLELEFTNVTYNDGTTFAFNATPWVADFVDSKYKDSEQEMEENDYSVRVIAHEETEQYEIQFSRLPAFSESIGDTLFLPMQLQSKVVKNHFAQLRHKEEMALSNCAAAVYLGKWVYVVKYLLFWIYAVLFGLLCIGRRDGSIWRHLILTAIIYLTLHWDWAPAAAFLITYYIYTPLLYVPFIKNGIINTFTIICTLATLGFLGWQAWQCEGFFPWVGDMAIWGFSAIVCLTYALNDTNDRCPHCGHLALSRLGNTERYENTWQHFLALEQDGSDLYDMSNGDITKKNGKKRCGHCHNLANN